MARSSIEEKMSSFWENKKLNKDLVSQSDVVYILVQLSKYNEREKVENINNHTDIPCIKFFRNWAVHGIIDKESKYINKILKESGETNGLFQKLSTELLKETENINLINIPENLKDSFLKSLFEVIKDVPIIVITEKTQLTATEYDHINHEIL